MLETQTALFCCNPTHFSGSTWKLTCYKALLSLHTLSGVQGELYVCWSLWAAFSPVHHSHRQKRAGVRMGSTKLLQCTWFLMSITRIWPSNIALNLLHMFHCCNQRIQNLPDRRLVYEPDACWWASLSSDCGVEQLTNYKDVCTGVYFFPKAVLLQSMALNISALSKCLI